MVQVELYSSLFFALLRVKTVNLSELATGFSGKAQTTLITNASRGFSVTMMNYAEIAAVALMAIPEPWVLSIDRTE